jgi:3-methylfumaryl-CoA hydratase
LLVLLMLELVRDKQIRSLSYRLRRPVFAGEHLRALGSPENGGASLRVATAREERNAAAEVSFA